MTQLSDYLGMADYGTLPNSTNNALGLNNETGLVPSPDAGGFNLAGLGSGLQGLAGLASAWAGLQGIKLGRDQLDFTKSATNRNLSNQAQTVNAELRDRQERRAAASGGGYQSVDDYMRRNAVDGSKL